jgi:hypothetical protein
MRTVIKLINATDAGAKLCRSLSAAKRHVFGMAEFAKVERSKFICSQPDIWSMFGALSRLTPNSSVFPARLQPAVKYTHASAWGSVDGRIMSVGIFLWHKWS